MNLIKCTHLPTNFLNCKAPSGLYVRKYSVVVTRVAWNFPFYLNLGSSFAGDSTVELGVPSCIDMFIWVVDSSNPQLFTASKFALHGFLKACDNLTLLDSKETSSLAGVPIVIVASKQVSCSYNLNFFVKIL